MTPPSGRAVPAGRRPARRRLLFALAAVAAVLLVLELAGAGAWWAMTGSAFTWGRATAARAAAREGGAAIRTQDAAALAAQRVVQSGVIVHPYFGFTYDHANSATSPAGVSEFGFTGTESPLRKRGVDRYVVGIVGGSVAQQFAMFATGALQRALARSPRLAGRRIEVVALGIGGYKEPQQLLVVETLLALGGEFDCIVNIDGFNEVALVRENVPLGVPAWYPRGWARLLDAVPTPEQQRRLGHIAVLAEDRLAAAATGDRLWWSPLAQVWWLARDRRCAADLAALRAEAERAAARPSTAVLGPGTGGRTVEQSWDDMAVLWRRASVQLQQLCTANGIRYFHFLQPNQYVPDSKPIGPDEAKVAIDLDHPWRPAVLGGYPLLQREAAALRTAGVDYTDLTRVFADVDDTIYTDTCCHFGARGNEIVAEHVAAAIRRRIELEGVKWSRVEVAPNEIALESPLVPQQLVVTGFDAAGEPHDVTGAGFGTSVDVEPAGAMRVGPDGRVFALRRGDAVLRVTNGAATAAVTVHARWPRLLEADDALAPAGGEAPRLVFELEQLVKGVPILDVGVVGMPQSTLRFVATSPRPLPASPVGVDPAELKLAVIGPDGESAKVRVLLRAPADEPTYLRFYALGADAKTVVAASRTMVITPDAR
ncbi:MAG: hypothetical protein U1E73_01960 [Planctomycetota bacterium]